MSQYNRDTLSDLGSLVRRHFGAGSLDNDEERPPLFDDFDAPLTSHNTTEAPSSGQRPLDLHTLWKLLEQMDRTKDNKVVGLSSLDGAQDSSNFINNFDNESKSSGKMSTWGT